MTPFQRGYADHRYCLRNCAPPPVCPYDPGSRAERDWQRGADHAFGVDDTAEQEDE